MAGLLDPMMYFSGRSSTFQWSNVISGEGIADETGPNPLFSLASIKVNPDCNMIFR